MKFAHLKAGDVVQRQMGYGGPTMLMIVVHVEDEAVYCDSENRVLQGLPLREHWKFDRMSGFEEDDGLRWGREYGKAGTFLIETVRQ